MARREKRSASELAAAIRDGERPTIAPHEHYSLLSTAIGDDIEARRDQAESDPTTFTTLGALLSHGVDVNARDTSGFCALRLAALYGKAQLVHWLLDRGADPFVMDNNGRTPRDEAETALRQRKERAQRLDQPMWLRAVPGLEQSIAMLQKAETESGRTRPPPPSPSDKWPILKTPVALRRGLCDRGLETVNRIMIRAAMDDLANFFDAQPDVLRVERNVLPRLSTLQSPPRGMISMIKLKGQPWVYVGGTTNLKTEQAADHWSAKLSAPVLHFAAQNTSDAAHAALYSNGTIQSKVQSPQSDWTNVDAFLKQQDAYLTLIEVGSNPRTGGLSVSAYFDDEAHGDNIERIDLIYTR